MRVGVHMSPTDLDAEIPDHMPEEELRSWAYQRYIKKYLRVVQSVDDNVGRMLDYLDEKGLTENTIIVYTSDQGFFLGDHGWYDKRFMYEESLKMPFVLRYPKEVAPRSTNDDLVLNVDFPALFLDMAGVPVPPEFQGRSFRPLLSGSTPPRQTQCRILTPLAFPSCVLIGAANMLLYLTIVELSYLHMQRITQRLKVGDGRITDRLFSPACTGYHN